MNYCHVKENVNVVVYIILLLLTFAKSPSACDLQYKSVSSNFQVKIKVLFNDYEVQVISNFELNNSCLGFWHNADTYTLLKTLRGKAESDLKKLIDHILTELSVFKNCSFMVPKTCIKQKQPLVQVLRKLDYQQLENITEVHYNCTQMRCELGNAIAHEPVDHHDNVTTKCSTKVQDAGTVPNSEDYVQQKRDSSNKTASHQDNEKPVSQKTGNILAIGLPLTVLLCVGVFVGLLCKLKKPRYEAGRTDDTEAQAGDH